MKLKTRRVNPPTRLLRMFILTLILISVSCLESCSLFKVYAGKVEYSDSQHSFTMSADSLLAERPIKSKFYHPIVINN